MREWVHIISNKIVDRSLGTTFHLSFHLTFYIGLFQIGDCDEIFYKFDTDNEPMKEQLQRISFFGRVCAKAFLERIPVPIYLNHSITRRLLGQKLEMEDLFTYDKHVILFSRN